MLYFSEIDMCEPSPCIHGECENTSPGDYICKCDFGFEGKHCDKGTNIIRNGYIF